jgi:CAAX protease family protein
MRSLVRRFPFSSFVLLSYAWTWPLAALIEQSLLFPMLGLFGPLIAAMVVIGATEGRGGVRALWSRFRVRQRDLPWLTVAVLLPIVLLVPVWLLARWSGPAIAFRPGPISLLSLLLAVLIVGEEVGWRGFGLPYLLARWPALASSLILGAVWAFWHLPNFLLPGFPHRGLPFPAFLILVLSYSVLFTWLAGKTEGSLMVALVFHAALNLFSVEGVDSSRQYWLRALVYGAAAVAVVVAGGFRGFTKVDSGLAGLNQGLNSSPPEH